MKNLWLIILLAIGGVFLFSRRGAKAATAAGKPTSNTNTGTSQPLLSDLFARYPVTNNSNDNAKTAIKAVADTLGAVLGGSKSKGGVSVGAGAGGAGLPAQQRARSSSQIPSAPAGDGIGYGIPYNPGEQVTSIDLPESYWGDSDAGDIFDYSGTYDYGGGVQSEDLGGSEYSFDDYWTDFGADYGGDAAAYEDAFYDFYNF